MHSTELLAKAFALRLVDEIGRDKVAETNERNKTYSDSACASHDFCDANMVMDAAFTAVMGREQDGSDPDMKLWATAWDMAIDHGFWLHG